MLTFEQIKELIELVSSHRLTGVELERSGFHLKIEGQPTIELGASAMPQVSAAPAAGARASATPPPGPAAEPSAVPGPAAAAPAARAAAEPGAATPPPGPEAPPPATEVAPPADAHVVNSPIVGTFYAAPNPDAKPYARVGDRVEQGQVLCIVEAMKLMNEIESDVDGVVLEIYPQNAQPVEYGEPLFAIRPG